MASSAAAAPSRAASAPQRLAVSIEGKPASVAFDAHLFWLSRGAAEAHSGEWRLVPGPHAGTSGPS